MKFIATAIFTVSIACTHSAFAQIAECDRLASSPLDPQKQSAGVSYSKIDHIAAVPACKIAITENKQAPRLWFQYGRALEKANKLPDAIVAYQEAAKLGSGAAHNNIGELYRDGKGFDADLKLAEEFFKKAADLNSTEGRDNLLSLQNKNKSNNTKTEPESSGFLYEVQLAAFRSKEEANIKINELSKLKIFAYISPNLDNSMFRVRRGPFLNLDDATKDTKFLNSIKIEFAIIRVTSNQSMLNQALANSDKIKKDQGEYLDKNINKEINQNASQGLQNRYSSLKVGLECAATKYTRMEGFSLYILDNSNGFQVHKKSGTINQIKSIQFSDTHLTFEKPIYGGPSVFYEKVRINRNSLEVESRTEFFTSGVSNTLLDYFSCKTIDDDQAFTNYLDVKRKFDESNKSAEEKSKRDKETQLKNRKF